MWALLSLVLLFGAGGSPSPVGEAVAITGGLALAAIAVWCFPDAIRMPSWPASAVIGALPLLALIQLIPISVPASASPIRALMVQSVELARPVAVLLPISLDPASTLWGLLALLPPLVAFFLASNCRSDDRVLVMRGIVFLAFCSAILQALQLLGNGSFFLHPRSINAGPSGFFANQNTQALFLSIGALASILLSRPALSAAPLPMAPTVACVLFLAVSCALTGSRAGIVLMLLAMLLAGLVAGKPRVPKKKYVVFLYVLAIAAVIYLLFGVRSSIVTIERFGALSEGRVQSIWPDTLYLLQQAWPLGTGIGTFPISFALVERLDVVDPTFANRAHSDWLEFLIEGGVAAAGILAGGCFVAVRQVWQYRRQHAEIGSAFGLGVLILVALHAAVDYPLRAIAMAVIAAVAWAWFAGGQIETKVSS